MSFENDFPSLKTILTIDGIRDYNIEFIPLSQVELHCLDKQKVREAINKLRKIHFEGINAKDNQIIDSMHTGAYITLGDLKKELGL